jgi:hypothetical protein
VARVQLLKRQAAGRRGPGGRPRSAAYCEEQQRAIAAGGGEDTAREVAANTNTQGPAHHRSQRRTTTHGGRLRAAAPGDGHERKSNKIAIAVRAPHGHMENKENDR